MAETGRTLPCRSCGCEIRFVRQPSGRWAPIEVASGENHFINCSARREWRRADAPRTAAPRKGR